MRARKIRSFSPYSSLMIDINTLYASVALFDHNAVVSTVSNSVNSVDNEVIHQVGIPLKGTLTMTDYEISVH